MGPQSPPWNSPLGALVARGSGSQDRASLRAGRRGRIFPGVRHDRFAVGLKPVGKVASFGRCYSPAACWPDC